MKKLLIIFVKNPEIGKVKTRLAKSIGDKRALNVYLNLLIHTQGVTDKLEEVDRAVYYSDFIDEEDQWDADDYQKFLQQGNGLGERMANAFRRAFQSGYDSVCLIGTDLYDLSVDLVNSAFKKLESSDVVIGPAKDGGYYLIGMKQPHDVFDLSHWSTPNVFSETMKLIDKNELSCSQTKLLNDIDILEDLKGTDLERLTGL
ncbi:TIGR04282 family arsenosugar biosynthesis glycosyltransferase [Fulvivirga sediminis]|uniref:TIGR04282 family arsenosugar biosynthesis glycosyltransferase n=1 Tax=Fulvivirga sediminis TaxID=2803949 RepID=A0A937F5J5_9BACT|nr:TIGR04282 family arsenosugar biosynthesis glycosyltransferase [Fulvivirga sediminis]MBL3655049.1 TIGR04282 family arsenosugar biosynthesis glycosyltransferase [Fulvivirga sediminis]